MQCMKTHTRQWLARHCSMCRETSMYFEEHVDAISILCYHNVQIRRILTSMSSIIVVREIQKTQSQLYWTRIFFLLIWRMSFREDNNAVVSYIKEFDSIYNVQQDFVARRFFERLGITCLRQLCFSLILLLFSRMLTTTLRSMIVKVNVSKMFQTLSNTS